MGEEPLAQATAAVVGAANVWQVAWINYVAARDDTTLSRQTVSVCYALYSDAQEKLNAAVAQRKGILERVLDV